MKIKSIIRAVVISIVIGYMSIVCILYFSQDSMIFINQTLTNAEVKIINSQFENCEEVRITTTDNIKLHGWYVKNSELKKAPLIIYFGGNAEEVSNFIHYKDSLKGWDIVAINYRGYGLSEGKPSEKNIFKDAEYIYDSFAKRSDIDNNKIIVMGRSLGSGVAVHLAYERKLAGVILVTPYDSITKVAQEEISYIPVSLFIKNPFDSIKIAPKISTPMIALAAENDTFIPPKHAIKLVEKWGGSHEIKIVKNTEHNTIQNGEGYWESINEFLIRIVESLKSE
ncbi:MAG: hypothetical protein A2Y18_04075 [Clostridiales bacterium GWD2_32_19]|nr:MAG: hypothetical protein A2Y18_04075 [Clostridiales bacterium GWD2_32_19]